MGIEQIEQPSQSRPITNGLESASAELAEIRPDHPLGDRDGLTVDDEVKKRHPAIFHLPVDGAPSSEKRVQGVFDLDFALVAGIINHALANVATSDMTMSGSLVADSFETRYAATGRI